MANEHLEAILKSAVSDIRTIECESQTKARSLRNALYQYRRIARHDYNNLTMKLDRTNLIIGPTEKLDRYWTEL